MDSEIEYIHYINHSWHLSQFLDKEGKLFQSIKRHLEERKTELQNQFIKKYSNQIELVPAEFDPNIFSIQIKGTDKDACHIPKEKINSD